MSTEEYINYIDFLFGNFFSNYLFVDLAKIESAVTLWHEL